MDIPSYGGQHVQLEGMPRERLDAQAPLEAFGGGASAERAAQATQGLGSEVQQIAEKAWHEANEVKVLDADNQMNLFEAKTVYDPKDGALTKRGSDTFDLPEKVMGAFDKRAGEIASTLTNDAQRNSFTHLANSRRFMLDRVVGRHVDNEIKAYQQQTVESSVKNSQDMAIVNYSIPHIVADQIDKQKAVLTDYGRRNGVAPEHLKQMIDVSVSTTHAGVIKQFAENGLSEVAESYMKANKDAITVPKDIQASEEIIRRRLPQDIASRVYDKAPMLPDGSPDRLGAQAMIDKVPGLDDTQKSDAFSAFESMANQAATALKRTNDGRDTAFFSKVTDLANKGVGVDIQKKLADQLVNRLPNGNPDQFDLSQKYKFIEATALGGAKVNDMDTVVALQQDMAPGSTVSSEQTRDNIIQAVKDGRLKVITATAMMGKLTTGQTKMMEAAFKAIEREQIPGDFPDKAEATKALGTLHSLAYDQNVNDPEKLHDLYDKVVKGSEKTGGSSWYFWDEKSRPIDTASMVLQNRPLTDAFGRGGIGAVMRLAQDLGGPEKLAVGTPYSKAIMAIVAHGDQIKGYKGPQSITPDAINAVIKKHPEWIK